MNAYLASALVVFGSQTASAGDAPPTPQPRVRLDPVTLTAIPGVEPARKAPTGVTMMDKVVVPGRSIPMERPKEQPYDGAFSARRGGRLLNGGSGSGKWEIGIWPSLDLMFTDSGARPRAEPRLNLDFVRIKF